MLIFAGTKPLASTGSTPRRTRSLRDRGHVMAALIHGDADHDAVRPQRPQAGMEGADLAEAAEAPYRWRQGTDGGEHDGRTRSSPLILASSATSCACSSTPGVESRSSRRTRALKPFVRSSLGSVPLQRSWGPCRRDLRRRRQRIDGHRADVWDLLGHQRWRWRRAPAPR